MLVTSAMVLGPDSGPGAHDFARTIRLGDLTNKTKVLYPSPTPARYLCELIWGECLAG